MESKTKKCSKCHEVKDLKANFRWRKPDKHHPKGYWDYYCNKCEADRARNDRAKDPIKYLYTVAKYRAKKKGVPFTITVEDLRDLQVTHCPCFGWELDYGGGKGKGNPSSASIDRIVPELGYVPGNVQIVSNLVNSMKFTATEEELRKFAKFILDEG